MKNTTININLPTSKKLIRTLSKIANQQSQNQSSATSSQENPTIPTTTQNPQTSTRISFQDNPYTFEERHARLSEPLEPVQRQAPLSEPTYNLYPTLPQELSRIRNISQNQNTVEINRQITHPRRNRSFQTPNHQHQLLIYPNHQHQLLQKTQIVNYQKLPHSFHNVAPQVYPQIT